MDRYQKWKVGIGKITRFDTKDYKIKLAAEVKGFSAKERLDAKSARRMATFSQFACAAAKEAYEDSGIEIERKIHFVQELSLAQGLGVWKR